MPRYHLPRSARPLPHFLAVALLGLLATVVSDAAKGATTEAELARSGAFGWSAGEADRWDTGSLLEINRNIVGESHGGRRLSRVVLVFQLDSQGEQVRSATLSCPVRRVRNVNRDLSIYAVIGKADGSPNAADRDSETFKDTGIDLIKTGAKLRSGGTIQADLTSLVRRHLAGDRGKCLKLRLQFDADLQLDPQDAQTQVTLGTPTLTLEGSGIRETADPRPLVNPELPAEPKLDRRPLDGEPPNIVVILADDLGYGDVSFNPHHPDSVSTPNIDRLARDGVICTNGYVSAPNCAPSRAALLTGRYQERFGLYEPSHSRIGLPANEVTLADVLGHAGYTSGIFGKWHLGFMPEHNPVEHGFDTFYGFLGHGGHDYFDLKIDEDNLHSAIRRGHKAIDDEGYLTNRITEEAIRFINTHAEESFFAYVAYNAPHAPLQAPEQYVDHYDTGDPERDTYLAMVEIMDEGIGRIVQTLKQNELYENTLIFFLSDNGGARANTGNNAPLRGAKQQMYEGGIRVPFVVTWPNRLEAGTSTDVPVICMDIFTTAAHAAGLSVPQERPIDGKNLLPALRGEVDQLHERLFWSQSRKGRESWAIRQRAWKRVTDRDTPGLFNLAEDTGEQRDLLTERAGMAQNLESTYRRWRETMADPLPDSAKHRRDQPLGDQYFSDEYLKKRR